MSIVATVVGRLQFKGGGTNKNGKEYQSGVLLWNNFQGKEDRCSVIAYGSAATALADASEGDYVVATGRPYSTSSEPKNGKIYANLNMNAAEVAILQVDGSSAATDSDEPDW